MSDGVLDYLLELTDDEWRDLRFRVERIRNSGRQETARRRERSKLSAIEGVLLRSGIVSSGLWTGQARSAPAGAKLIATTWPGGRALHLIVVRNGRSNPACGDLSSNPIVAKVQLVEVAEACRRCTKFRKDVGFSIVPPEALYATEVGFRAGKS